MPSLITTLTKQISYHSLPTGLHTLRKSCNARCTLPLSRVSPHTQVGTGQDRLLDSYSPSCASLLLLLRAFCKGKKWTYGEQRTKRWVLSLRQQILVEARITDWAAQAFGTHWSSTCVESHRHGVSSTPHRMVLSSGLSKSHTTNRCLWKLRTCGGRKYNGI